MLDEVLSISPGKIRPTGLEVKCICLLNHPNPNTYNDESVQIIIPGPQVGRVNDTAWEIPVTLARNLDKDYNRAKGLQKTVPALEMSKDT